MNMCMFALTQRERKKKHANVSRFSATSIMNKQADLYHLPILTIFQ